MLVVLEYIKTIRTPDCGFPLLPESSTTMIVIAREGLYGGQVISSDSFGRGGYTSDDVLLERFTGSAALREDSELTVVGTDAYTPALPLVFVF